jgi:outer membrane protein assembly factor BamB
VIRSLLTVWTSCVLIGSAAAENWPQWRGPQNNGISSETNLPAEWSETKNLVWKLALPGQGNSTPCIWGDRMFLTAADGGDLLLLCISTKGKELWRKKLGSGVKPKSRADEGNDASSSPSTDGKHVYAFGGTGDFACFDFDGNEVWRFNGQQRWGKFRIAFGMHTTPVLHKDRLYLQLIHAGTQAVVAIDKTNGKDVWKVDRPSDGRAECLHSYASAFMWDNGKDAYLVAHGNDYTTAHALDDGKEIWRLGDLNPKGSYNPTLRFVASPVTTPDLIVVPTAKRGAVVAVKPDAKGEIRAGSDGELWRIPSGTPDVPSPLVHDGLVYLSGETGGVTVREAKTGKQLYSERTHDSRHRASPVYADGKVYMTSRDGVFTVIKAGREYEQLAQNRLPDVTTASPAISNGRIYIRGWNHLWAFGASSN